MTDIPLATILRINAARTDFSFNHLPTKSKRSTASLTTFCKKVGSVVTAFPGHAGRHLPLTRSRSLARTRRGVHQ